MKKLNVNNWKEATDDPVNEFVRNSVVKHLLSIRKGLPKNDYTLYLKENIKSKSVLDIGICEHTKERIDSPGWKHRIIKENSDYCLGIDINTELVSELKEKGFNVLLCDATSNTDIGERFNVVHCGDVIEHVDNPVALLSFCARHLSDNGKIIIRTPNPYCFNYVYLHKKIGTDKSNLEHLFYICPIHAMELARRCGLKLTSYYTLTPKGSLSALKHFFKFRFRHAIAELFARPETYSTILIYEFER